MTTTITISVLGAIAGWVLINLAIYAKWVCGVNVLNRYPLLFTLVGLVFIVSNVRRIGVTASKLGIIEGVLYTLVTLVSLYIAFGLYTYDNEGVNIPFVHHFYKEREEPPLTRGPSKSS